MKRKHVTEEMVQATLDRFSSVTPVLSVLSDENRQLIISELGRCDQLNVKELDELIPLSRPAISHHLKILKQAGIINNKKKGTENYYFLTIKSAIEDVRDLCNLIEQTCQLL
jgi:DNA-binding transcriptional ArsR family regulator